MELCHRTTKADCIRPGTPLTLDDARRIVAQFVKHYNEVRLHIALGYVTPATKLAGREKTLFAQRDAKLEAARQRRQRQLAETARRVQQERAEAACYSDDAWSEDRALLGSNPSAKPGARPKSKAVQAAACLPSLAPSVLVQSEKPNYEARTGVPCTPNAQQLFTETRARKIRFTLSQYTTP